MDEYKFVENKDGDAWRSQPNFKEDLRNPQFHNKATEVQRFFHLNNDWERTKRNFKGRKNKLLMITAARYLLVTSILYKESRRTLIPCSRELTRQGKKYVIPKRTGVCYPVPYGSASYKSDYDVGLIGKQSGSLTERFNKYFERTFGRPSELVFDTNVYAFTLEFAIPSMFINLPWNFETQVTRKEKKGRVQNAGISQRLLQSLQVQQRILWKVGEES